MSGKFRHARKAYRLGRCLDGGLGEIVVPVKMQVTRAKTERPRGALLQLGIVFWYGMYRIGGRLRSRDASFGGVVGGIPH